MAKNFRNKNGKQESHIWFSWIQSIKPMAKHQRDSGLKVRTSNLCSEIMLHTGLDHHGNERTAVCCLSSVNLRKMG